MFVERQWTGPLAHQTAACHLPRLLGCPQLAVVPDAAILKFSTPRLTVAFQLAKVRSKTSTVGRVTCNTPCSPCGNR